VAASAVAGYITTADDIPLKPKLFESGKGMESREVECAPIGRGGETIFRGKIWYIPRDNIDTDMIYHNRYLTITNIDEMGQYTFDNLEGYEDFAKKVKPDDIVVVGKNFGAGSSRQQAVDCFRSLGVSIILAESFGAIYERNAINGGMPIMKYKPGDGIFDDGDEIEVDITTGNIRNLSKRIDVKGDPFSEVQLDIYRRGGLLVKPCGE
jgi:3-isopropylmalate dehydratase small subunit